MRYDYQRRKSSEVKIGDTPLGGNNPIRLQSMTNTSTLDTEGSVAQAIRIIRNGAAYVRLTAQGEREANNLRFIREGIRQAGYTTPLVADIHFNPRAADAAALHVEKVRINPGNYVDSARTFKQLEYTDAEYAQEIEKIRERLLPFLQICRENNTAIRIGVNHGSLSDRIMSRYGDTPEGMVESCLEFLRICVAESFFNVVISIKASNTVVMVRTVRLLVGAMEREGMAFPLHLGVTEAGDGEDGRIKSAIGIGALLSDGIGDTIRVSLSEAPELEVPVARKLVEHIVVREGLPAIEAPASPSYNPYDIVRRPSHTVGPVGGGHVPVVIADYSLVDTYPQKPASAALQPDFFYIGDRETEGFGELPVIRKYEKGREGSLFLYRSSQLAALQQDDAPIKFLALTRDELTAELLSALKDIPSVVILAEPVHPNIPADHRAMLAILEDAGLTNPVILKTQYAEQDPESLQIKAGADYGANLIDQRADGITITNTGYIPTDTVSNYMFGMLQAARLRTTKTEYISCPGCGRTLFDLESTIARVKAATGHLTGLKIGIMGCIVNGPGEMADADYGYVGAGRGRVSLYKNKTCLEKNIPEAEAVTKLVDLIKQYGDWKD